MQEGRQISKKKWAINSFIILCVILFSVLTWRVINRSGSSGDLLNIKETNFKTPEEAVSFFMEGIAENDIKKALAAGALKERADYAFTEGITNLGFYDISSLWPGSYAMYRDLNEVQNMQSLMIELKYFISALLLPDQIPHELMQADRSEQLEDQLDPSVLSDLKLDCLIDAKDTGRASTDILDHSRERLKKFYHLEDAYEGCAIFTWKNQPYAVGVTLMKKNQGWKISTLSSLSLEMPSASVTPLTEEQYQKVLDYLKN